MNLNDVFPFPHSSRKLLSFRRLLLEFIGGLSYTMALEIGHSPIGMVQFSVVSQLSRDNGVFVMKSLMNYWPLVANVFAAVGILASARGDETAVAFDNSTIGVGEGGSAVYGWQFSTLSDIQISALGLYDFFRGDGFVAQHPVAIWDISDPSQPLVSTVIPAGTLAPIVQGFRYVSVHPVVLPAGHDYAIGALYMSDDDTVGALNTSDWSLTVGPDLQFDGYRYGGMSSPVLTFPESYIAGEQETFGPNFTYTIVPEPSALDLCVLGSVVLPFLMKTWRFSLPRVPSRLPLQTL